MHTALLTTSDPQPRVYGINDMSIFSNRLVPGSPSQLYLAEIEEGHAGKKLELGLGQMKWPFGFEVAQSSVAPAPCSWCSAR